MNIRDDDFILSQLHDGYLVGGAVRDLLISCGQKICDRDIAVKNAETFAKNVSEKFGGTLITLDFENQIFRVVLQDKINYLDISELRGNTIEEDLRGRDFTINAIAVDLRTGRLIDVTGGVEDIKNKILREINEKNFRDDPLRILRAFRFLSVTGFKMTENLERILAKYADLALNPAKERINYEIMKLFGGRFSAEALLKMDEIGILEMFFSCVKELKQVPANSHHHLDLFHHSVETVRQIELLYETSSLVVKDHLDSIDFGGFPRINHLKLAGFLHDIGKFSTWTIEGEKCIKLANPAPQPGLSVDCKSCTLKSKTCGGRHRFIKHDDAGSKLVIPLLKDLKFSKKQIDYLSFIIKNHIYPSSVMSAPDINEKSVMRCIRKLENNIIDSIILAKADRLSARGIDVTEDMINSNLNGLTTLLNYYISRKDSLKPLPKLIDGNEIIQILNIPPSPELGKIINTLKEAQLNGDITTRDEALKFIRDKYAQKMDD